ncbi:MAG: NAD-glutamate dehydrogenase [Alphaproteobacteria bacterium]|nr:NAD-glutamate dehydrogenase [Alphaproteobacteria bacterium]
MSSCTCSWSDKLASKINGAEALKRNYAEAFPQNYKDDFDISNAVEDTAKIEEAINSNGISVLPYKKEGAKENELSVKIFNSQEKLRLSDIVPMLENMGFLVVAEQAYYMEFEDKCHAWIRDISLISDGYEKIELKKVKENVEETFIKLWSGELENGPMNRLVVKVGLSWREITVLRAYSRYLKQIGFSLSQKYVTTALASNPEITSKLIDLFNVSFAAPSSESTVEDRKEDKKKIKKAISKKLNSIESADEDRIIKSFVNIIDSTLRTNFFQADKDGNHKSCLSMKLDSQKIDNLPLPRPFREIFVYSPEFQGVHLRCGRVARGGLRWSDRPEDFRTEILDLVKAQQVKNVVIVPFGSKGGFVLKKTIAEMGREAYMEHGIECYKNFIRSMLDLTDNIIEGKTIHPKDVVILDDADPYLVVAADKGTATFSDIANGVSEEYGFWLGDAFASGGSVGYDHKKMGITARGAWECVKRHFREIDVNTQTTDFTVVGVGDMSGDVFGNGMLCSKHINLVAAFNHLHIFVDPNPDAAGSYKERKRLFNLPRSTWDDYNKDLLSKGGMVFSRFDKTVKLTQEIKARFGIEENSISPNALIREILRAQVDLLWFGGIGTYLKASFERHSDASDRSNDRIRVDATDVRAQVIGEGANLGVTQRARIEFAELGGRINTDAMDNSAGVDTSDHEVNIKILLNEEVAKENLTRDERDSLLGEMTDELADLVLQDNYLQSQAISTMQARGASILDDQERLMSILEKEGLLNREVENLPSSEEMEERIASKKPFSRPELCVLMAYSKIWLSDKILSSDLPDDPMFEKVLINYFPTPLRDRFVEGMSSHKLKREIIATIITNSLINRMGGTFITSMMEKSGMAPSVIARAYIIARISSGICYIWDKIEKLDNKMPASAQIKLFIDKNKTIERFVLWILRNYPGKLNLEPIIDELSSNAVELEKHLDHVQTENGKKFKKEKINSYLELGISREVAVDATVVTLLFSSCDIGILAKKHGIYIEDAAKVYYAVGDRFKLRWLRLTSDRLQAKNRWEELSLSALREEIYEQKRQLASCVIATIGEKAIKKMTGMDAVNEWAKLNEFVVQPVDQLFEEITSFAEPDLAMLSVANRQIKTMGVATSCFVDGICA